MNDRHTGKRGIENLDLVMLAGTDVADCSDARKKDEKVIPFLTPIALQFKMNDNDNFNFGKFCEMCGNLLS